MQLIGKKIEEEIFRIFRPWRLSDSSSFFNHGQHIIIKYHTRDKSVARPLYAQSMSYTHSMIFNELKIYFYFDKKTQTLTINKKPVTNQEFLHELNNTLKIFNWEVLCDENFNLSLKDNTEVYLPYNIEFLEKLNIKFTGETSSGFSGNWKVFQNTRNKKFKIYYHYNHTHEKVEVILNNKDSKFIYTFNELVEYLIENKCIYL